MTGGNRYQEYRFDCERLNVYQKAVDFTNDVFNATRTFDRELRYSLGDQFRRAALSICNNLAEGSRKSRKGRVQFYQYALDSARECIPMLTVSVRQKGLSAGQELMFREQATHIANMLYRLIESCS